MTEIDKQERTNREEGLENIIESMYGEDCGVVHASAKRKKKKVKEQQVGDDPNYSSNPNKRGGTLFKQKKPQDCDHCDGTGEHTVKDKSGASRGKEPCQVCGGSGKTSVKYDENTSHYVNKEAVGPDLRQEVDEYLTTAVHTTGAEDLKANVLEIIDRHLGGGGQAAAAPSPAPTGPLSSPARQSQSPHRPSGMSGLGM